MKLSYFQLEAQLSKKLAPVYIVSGEDLFLKQEAMQVIRDKAKQAGFSERVRITADSGFDWDELYTLLYSHSLLAEKRLIEIDFSDTTPNKTAVSILQTFAEKFDQQTDTLLLIELGKLDEKINKAAWFQLCEKAGIVVTIWPLPREQLPQWITQRAKKNQIQFQPDAIQLLIDYVEGNLIAASQAIEKLALLNPTTAINAEMVEAILINESHFTVFDLMDALMGTDAARAIQVLNSLKEEGVEPILVLWAITRELRLLIDMSEQRAQGMNFDAVFQKHRVFPKRQPAMKRFLTRFQSSDFQQALFSASSIDKSIKGLLPGDPWDMLAVFLLRFEIKNI